MAFSVGELAAIVTKFRSSLVYHNPDMAALRFCRFLVAFAWAIVRKTRPKVAVFKPTSREQLHTAVGVCMSNMSLTAASSRHVVKLESEMVQNYVKIMIVSQPSQAKNAYAKLLASLHGDKFVGVDCEGTFQDSLALMVQVSRHGLYLCLLVWVLGREVVRVQITSIYDLPA